MKDKRIIVIGASSGIGKACVELLASDNTVLYTVARNEVAMKETASSLPGEIKVIPYDLNELDGIKEIFSEVKKDKEKVDALVYCAGVDAFTPIKVTSPQVMQRVMNLNCFAFCESARCFYNRQISKDGAVIVTISSIASLLNEKGQMPYTASKAALNSVVKTMAQEFSNRKIRVNAILPAGVVTPMAQSKGGILDGIQKNDKDNSDCAPVARQFMGAIPAQVIAENVKFLLSDASLYTTGELLTIGAGYNY